MSASPGDETGRAQILIVEDSSTQAEMLKHLLVNAGYEVIVAGNGKEALAILENTLPGLILSDIVMPEMDGYELCHIIKHDERFKKIPVILVTALYDPRDVIQGLENGADNFIIKPYEEKYLLTRVEIILAGSQADDTEVVQMGLDLTFAGKKHHITATRLQILNILLSTYETAIQKNQELNEARTQLRTINEHLEELVTARTGELKIKNQQLSEEIGIREKTEEALRRRTRAYQVISECNQFLVRASDEQDLTTGICKIVVTVGGYRAAWVGYGRDDENKTVEPVAQSGFEKDYLTNLSISWKKGRHGNGPTGSAIRTGNSVVIHDIPEKPECGSWRSEAVELDYSTAAAFPLIIQGQVTGALTIFSRAPDSFDPDEILLLSEMAHDLAFGIAAIRTRIERNQALEAVNERLKEQHSLYEISSLSVLPDISLDEIMKRAVMLLPAAFRFPEITSACIILEGQTFQTVSFRETPWMISHEIITNGIPAGQVTVSYLEERQAGDEGPFLPEEHQLLNAIAEQLSHTIARKKAEERIVHLNAVLRAIRNVNELIVTEKDRDRLLQEACLGLVTTRGFGSAWIALLDPSGRLTSYAKAGIGEEFASVVEPMTRGILPECGRMALARPDIWFTERVNVHCPPCPLAGDFKVNGAMAVRLEHEGEVYGFIAVSVPSEFVLDEEEKRLFLEVTGDIAYALHGLKADGERKQAVEALGESEEKYRLVSENVPVVVYSSLPDEKSTTLFVSGRVEELTGYTHDEFMADEDIRASMVHPDDRERVGDALTEHRQRKAPLDIEYRINTKSGEVRWVRDSATPMLDGHGGIVQVAGFMEDITQQKINEEKVRNAQEQIEEDMEKMAVFNDQIRNPLAVIVALLDMEEGSDTNTRILEQVYNINSLITTLDQQYMGSEKIREFLKKHSGFGPGKGE